MATYTWEFGAAGSGLHFNVVYDDGTKKFTITSSEGSFDPNALWFSDGDGESDGFTLAKSDNSLNMNGSNTVWDDDGNATSEKIVWDDYQKLSSTGLGPDGTDKATFVSVGGSITFDAPEGYDPEAFGTLGVRATSVNGGDSIKWVDTEAVFEGDPEPPEPNYFTINLTGDGELNIVADHEDDYTDNFGDADGADGSPGVAGTGLNVTGNYNNEDYTAGSGFGGGDGTDAEPYTIGITNAGPYDGILINSTGGNPNFLYGGDGGNGGNGGAGGSITITGNANSSELTAGNGGDGGDGGDGGHAIDNGNLNVVIIEGDQDLTILGGDGGAAGAGGAGGTVNVTGNTNTSTTTNGTAGNEGTAGTGVIAAFSDPVDVDASAFTGHLTISGSPEGDTFIAGSGGSDFYGTTGDDDYMFGSGQDTLIYTSTEQSNGTTSTDTIDNFDFVEDRLDFSGVSNATPTLSNTDDTLEVDWDGNDPDMQVVIVGLVDWLNEDPINTLNDLLA